MTVRKIIGLLQESMPGAEIEVAELNERTRDPLQEVASQLNAGKTGPVMILGLAEAVPSSEPSHSVLRLLNLQRPEWRKRIPRPVVLWLPEYVLSLMGVEAPDFLDWRSDTLFFPSDEPMLDFLASDVWTGWLDNHAPGEYRRVRVDELWSRLRALTESPDPEELSARSSWLSELGHHLTVFGDLAEAENAYRDSLRIERDLHRTQNIAAAYNNLGMLAMMRGHSESAAEMFLKGIEINEQIGNRVGLVDGYSNLAAAAGGQGDFTRAEELLRKALDLQVSLGLAPHDLVVTYVNLARVHLSQNRIDEAESLLKEALRLQVRDGMTLAFLYRTYAEASFVRGDYKRAVKYLRKALATDQDMHYRQGMARDLALIGALKYAQGEPRSARSSFERALEHYQALGDDSMVSILREALESIPSVPQ